MRLSTRVLMSPVALIWLTWAMVVVPRLAQSLTAPKHRTTVRSEGVGYSTVANLADSGLRYLLIGYCLLIIFTLVMNRSFRLSVMIVFFLAPWFVLVLRDVYLGDTPQINTFLYPLLGVAIWLMRPNVTHIKHLGYAVGATAVISIFLGFLLPDAGIYRAMTGELITPDKQILPWGILVGPFTSGNNLGQFLVLGLPAVFLIGRLRTRLILTGLIAFAIVWTSSRSSLIALGVCLAVFGVLLVRHAGIRGIFAVFAMITAGLVAVGLPIVTEDPLAFTNRGYIWDVSMRQWAQDPWFGHGSQWFSTISRYQTELGGYAFHAHNQSMQDLVTGGIVLAAALGLQMTVLIGLATRDAVRRRPVPAVYLATLFVTCWFEVSFAIVDRLLLVPVTVLPLAFVMFHVTGGGRAGSHAAGTAKHLTPLIAPMGTVQHVAPPVS